MDDILAARIQARIEELCKAERAAEIELIACRAMLRELQALLAPVATSGGDDQG